MPLANARTSSQLLAAALACALGVGMNAATAQDKAPALPMAEADSHLLPVWNARSGRLEAVLLLDRKQEQPGTLDWLLADKARTTGIGLQSSLSSGSRVGGALTLDSNSSSLALLCNQGIHMAISLGQGQHCLLAQVAAPGDPLLTRSGSPIAANLGAGWQSASGLFDLNFGLSWLSAPLADLATASAIGHSALDWARPWSNRHGEFQIRNLNLGGSLHLPGQRWLSLDAALSTQDMVTLSGGPRHWDSAAVTLGVGMRGLSGRLTGRLLELPEGGNWSGLDLGFSWRTPWQGELSFGADNLLDTKSPDTTRWPLQELPPLESQSGRVPYVRYKQDL